MGDDRLRVARACYGAYESGDRAALDRHLSENLAFYSPADPGIGREEYFERCWPNAERIRCFEFRRLIEVDDEIVATYEAERVDGSRFRNTEILTFDGDKITRVEVYFGWDLTAS